MDILSVWQFLWMFLAGTLLLGILLISGVIGPWLIRRALNLEKLKEPKIFLIWFVILYILTFCGVELSKIEGDVYKKLYDVLRIFTFSANDFKLHEKGWNDNWLLLIMIWVDSIFMVTAFLSLAAKKVAHSVLATGIPKVGEHVIIFGLGSWGLHYAMALAKNGTVVVIEKEPTDAGVKEIVETWIDTEYRGNRIHLIEGDCFDPETLKKANISRANKILPLLKDDGANIDAAYKVREILSKKDEEEKPSILYKIQKYFSDIVRNFLSGKDAAKIEPVILLPVDNIRLSTSLATYKRFSDHRGETEIRFFNIMQQAAVRHFINHPPELYADIFGHRNVHFAIYGLGDFAINLIYVIGHIGHFRTWAMGAKAEEVVSKKVRVTIYDQKPEKDVMDDLHALFPNLNKIIEIKYVSTALMNIDFNDIVRQCNPVTQHIFCVSNETLSVRYATKLRKAQVLRSKRNVPIFIRSLDGKGVARLVESNCGDEEWPDNIYPLVLLSNSLGENDYFTKPIDNIAKAFNDYKSIEREKGKKKQFTDFKKFRELKYWRLNDKPYYDKCVERLMKRLQSGCSEEEQEYWGELVKLIKMEHGNTAENWTRLSKLMCWDYEDEDTFWEDFSKLMKLEEKDESELWRNISSDFKHSSYYQAFYLSVRLKSIGYEWQVAENEKALPLHGWLKEGGLHKHIAHLEHDRWKSERCLLGWNSEGARTLGDIGKIHNEVEAKGSNAQWWPDYDIEQAEYLPRYLEEAGCRLLKLNTIGLIKPDIKKISKSDILIFNLLDKKARDLIENRLDNDLHEPNRIIALLPLPFEIIKELLLAFEEINRLKLDSRMDKNYSDMKSMIAPEGFEQGNDSVNTVIEHLSALAGKVGTYIEMPLERAFTDWKQVKHIDSDKLNKVCDLAESNHGLKELVKKICNLTESNHSLEELKAELEDDWKKIDSNVRGKLAGLFDCRDDEINGTVEKLFNNWALVKQQQVWLYEACNDVNEHILFRSNQINETENITSRKSDSINSLYFPKPGLKEGMIRGNDLYLNTDNNALTVQKRALPVEVTFADIYGVCKTKEGDVSYKAGDAIMTGVEGEQWPIEWAKFDATYEPITPTKAGENGSYSKKPIPVYALQMGEPFYVDVSWGADHLEGKLGDWLLQYGPDDYGIVSKSIFEKTYEIIK